LKITRREFALGTFGLRPRLRWRLAAPLRLEPFPANRLRFRASGAGRRPRARRPDGAQPLGEMAMGDEKAPITVIEYASMTCPHCAHFSETTFPELKEALHRYRQGPLHFPGFPLDQLAAAGFILARCAGPDKYFRS